MLALCQYRLHIANVVHVCVCGGAVGLQLTVIRGARGGCRETSVAANEGREGGGERERERERHHQVLPTYLSTITPSLGG